MRRVVISTVGTSLLTKQIGGDLEKDWYGLLRDSANLKASEIDNERAIEVILTLQERASSELQTANTQAARRLSAELNGIYGIYNDKLERGKEDIHLLIATDTEQGKVTAEIVKDYLQSNGIANASCKIARGLSTASTTAFTEGIDDLIVWFKQNIKSYQDQGYKICFNLVGGFKSLQGYLNTIGMFYADEIIYIFEGAGAELITIPRLPISVDREALKPHVVKLALLDAGAALSINETKELPESLIANVDGQITFSTWGSLIWSECKDEFLSDSLLKFPRLEYQDTFRSDYDRIKTPAERIKLQEKLAYVSRILKESDGDVRELTNTGLKYSPYKKSKEPNIDHFYISMTQRVSCKATDGKLILRYYGTHDRVQGTELYQKG